MRDASKPGRRFRRLACWLCVPLLAYAAWCTVLYLRQDSLIFPRHLAGRALAAPPAEFESLWISDGDIRVEAWFLPAAGAAEHAPAPLVIFCHGNGELIDQCLDVAAGWHERGWSVLLPEYRGFGRSGGAPSERAIVADTLQFYDLAARRSDVDPARVVVHGRSLGGGVASQVATARSAAALIIESGFTSVASFAWGMGVPPFVVRHPFRNDIALKGFVRPLLLLHGDRDEIIPISHSRALHALVPSSELVELAGDHNNFPDDPRAYWGAIDQFLAAHDLAGGPTQPR